MPEWKSNISDETLLALRAKFSEALAFLGRGGSIDQVATEGLRSRRRQLLPDLKRMVEQCDEKRKFSEAEERIFQGGSDLAHFCPGDRTALPAALGWKRHGFHHC